MAGVEVMLAVRISKILGAFRNLTCNEKVLESIAVIRDVGPGVFRATRKQSNGEMRCEKTSVKPCPCYPIVLKLKKISKHEKMNLELFRLYVQANVLVPFDLFKEDMPATRKWIEPVFQALKKEPRLLFLPEGDSYPRKFDTLKTDLNAVPIEDIIQETKQSQTEIMGTQWVQENTLQDLNDRAKKRRKEHKDFKADTIAQLHHMQREILQLKLSHDRLLSELRQSRNVTAQFHHQEQSFERVTKEVRQQFSEEFRQSRQVPVIFIFILFFIFYFYFYF